MFKKFVIDRKKALEMAYTGALAGIAIALKEGNKRPWIPAGLDWLQFGVIFVLFVIAMRDDQETAKTDSRCSEPICQFLHYWKKLWGFWLLLYLIFGIHDTFKGLNHGNPLPGTYWATGLNLVANFFNNLQSLCIFLLFLVMARKTTETHHRVLRIVWAAGGTLIVVLSVLELAFCVLPEQVFASPLPSGVQAVSRVLGIVFSAWSGMFAGVSFCLLFGRLGSHFIGLSLLSVGLLYLYATIQPLYPVFRILDTYPLASTPSAASASMEAQAALEVIQTILKVVAGFLKLVLFLRVREILKDGRLAHFFERMAEETLRKPDPAGPLPDTSAAAARS